MAIFDRLRLGYREKKKKKKEMNEKQWLHSVESFGCATNMFTKTEDRKLRKDIPKQQLSKGTSFHSPHIKFDETVKAK